MLISEITEIRDALYAISKKPNLLSLLIARNLAIADRLIKREAKALEKAHKPLLELDEKGEPILYVVDLEGNFLNDKDGNPRIFKSFKETPINKKTEGIANKKTDIELYDKLTKQHDEDDTHKIEWRVIPEEKLNEAIAVGNIEGCFLAPLIGTVIAEQ